MSIAVSVTVQPSRILRMMLCVMCAAVLLSGVLVALGAMGELPRWLRIFIAISAAFVAFIGFYHDVRGRKILHIDISGEGRICIAEIGSTKPCIVTEWPHLKSNGQVFRLLPDSTIWACLLLLRLQNEQGGRVSVMVLPDSVGRSGFRDLLVACRWIAAHATREKEGSEFLRR